MRIEHRYLTFERNARLVKLLDKLMVKYSLTDKWLDSTTNLYVLEFHLYEDDPRFSELKGAIKKFGIDAQIGTDYEKTDFESADWFIAITGEYQYPQPEDDFGYIKATFNTDNYCRHCGIGGIQNAPYRLKSEPKQTKMQFWGLHWEFEAIFVRPVTKALLEKEKFSGIRFSKPVLHKKNGT